MKKNEIKIYPDTKIFVVCPAQVKTGGPEVLHQLVNVLQEYIETYILYINIKRPITPEEFLKYNCKYVLHLENIYDNDHNIIITAETATSYLFKLKKIQKILWWLSVDNYANYLTVGKGKEKLDKLFRIYLRDEKFVFNLHKNKVVHMVQSEYARQYVFNHGVKKSYYLSDYINDLYLSESCTKNDYIQRENSVLYNPQKGYEFTKKIIEKANDIQFIPIVNMSNKEIISLMRKAKVYIDFGHHPGKDRLPREAALMGLCIITGKRGSAKNDIDISIPSKYKFEDNVENIDEIIKCINDCFKNYETKMQDFDSYREIIKNEKDEFYDCVKSIFKS